MKTRLVIKLKHDKDVYEEIIENADSYYFGSGNFVVYFDNRSKTNMYKVSTVLQVKVEK